MDLKQDLAYNLGSLFSPCIFLYFPNILLDKCQEIAAQWLAELDLELKPSKTRITHTLNQIEPNSKPGFDFLGFNIRSYPVGKNNCGQNNGTRTDFKTLVRPASEKVKNHYEKLAKKITQCRPATQDELIAQLIPIITRWCNYYASACSSEVFSELDHKLFWKLFRGWGKFRHPKKSGRWIARKYWHIQKHKNWTFGMDKLILPKHSNTKIARHIKVRGETSPYGKNRDNRLENLVAVHLHCHDQIHDGKGNLSTQLSTHDKGQFGEEPDERKLSRPVLKPSMGGDSHA